MARIQLFLSTVSAEFLSYRERLRHPLTSPDVEVKMQEDCIDMTGAMAKPQSVAAIASRYPELASLSYTQWEARLALLHGKKLYIATPSDGAPRDEKFRREPEHQALQPAYLAQLRSMARYPGIEFSGQDNLAAEVLPFESIGPLFKGRSILFELLEKSTRPQALVGPGGVGKTRLAIEHAWRQIGRCNAVPLFVATGSRIDRGARRTRLDPDALLNQRPEPGRNAP